jgi:septum formation protein
MVLASRSPQRRAILDQIGVEYDVEVPDVEELQSGPPHEVALENAFRKASAVAPRAPDALVLGVDTLVSLGVRLYGKPADEDGRPRTAAASTVVEFRALDETLLDWYLASGEWRDRAGAYAIQGRGAALVAGIDGDFLNVVGLPVTTLLELAPKLLSG